MLNGANCVTKCENLLVYDAAMRLLNRTHEVARPDLASRALWFSALAASLLLLFYKFVLIGRLNINWDEFYYLSYVHAGMRGELNLLLHGAYTHLFSWLPFLDTDEIGQIAAARTVMMVLLCITAWLVWRLARIWTNGFAALLAPFVYLSSMPVMVHGGSFRSDSLLAPLLMGALVVLASARGEVRRDLWAGVMLGAALTATIKTAIFAPVIAGLLLFRDGTRAFAPGSQFRGAAAAAIRLAAIAGATTVLLVFLHSLTIAGDAESAVEFGTRAATKTLVDVPWFPRLDYLLRYVHWQPLHWLLILLGTLAALARRRFDLACLSLALLPVALYRNAYSYFYIVMLAPLSVLAAYAVHEMRDYVSRRARPSTAGALVAVIWAGLLYQGFAYIGNLRADDQISQRALISAVHQIFPEPVDYVDRCGMIASFRKVNPFMSTWGMESYRRQAKPFMPAAIRERHAAFVLVNHSALSPARRNSNDLLPEDSDLLVRYYPRYWGPVRVAGAIATITDQVPTSLAVPFAADYRVVTPRPILIDGTLRHHGDVISVPAGGVTAIAPRTGLKESGTETQVKLFLAAAQPPPKYALPKVPLFAGL